MMNRLMRQTARTSSIVAAALALLACSRGTGRLPLDVPAAEAAPGTESHGPAPTKQAAPAPENEATPAEKSADPGKAARSWLDAPRAHDVEALAKRSRFPFVFKDTGAEGKCKSATIPGADKLAAGVQCLVKDDLLTEDLKSNPEPTADVLSVKSLPRWSRKWAKEIPAGATPVSVFFNGNGNSFDLVLLVAGDGVQGFWKHATFEPN
jgi:hypothetical protein